MKYIIIAAFLLISGTLSAQTYKPKDIKEKPKLRALLIDKQTNQKQYVLITKINKNFFYWHDSSFVKLDTSKWRIMDTVPYHPQDTAFVKPLKRNQ